MVLFTDDFNRADQSDLGNGWDNVGQGEYGAGYGLNIVGNQAEGDVDFGVCREIYGTPADTAAIFVQADFIDVFNATSWQVGVNVDPAVFRGGYWLDKYEWYSEWYLYRDGTTVVTQGGYASGIGWTDVRLEHDGAGNLTASEGGVEILTYTDGSPLTTNKYFGIAQKGGHIDNFSAGDLGELTAITPVTEAQFDSLTTAVVNHAATKIIKLDIGADGSAARTAGAAVQMWFCNAGVTPTNAVAGDIIYTRS